MKFLLASLKTVTYSKNFPESRIKFLVRLSFALIGLYFPVYCTFIAGLRNIFQDHRRFTKQLLDVQAAIRRPEQALEG
jgi:hypothetical protein